MSPTRTRLYFVRHGESEANLLHVFSNRDLPHGLTPTGRAQMERLAEKLTGIPFAACYVSPALRARQSAEVLGARLGLGFTVTPALAEFDVGVLEGRSDAASWRRYDALMDAWLSRGELQARIEGGESFEEMRARFFKLIEGLQQEPRDGPVLLLTHGGLLVCLLPHLLSNVSIDFARKQSLGHAEVIIAEMRHADMVCLRWGSTWLSSACTRR